MIADTAFWFRALFSQLRLDVILQRGHLAQPQLLLAQPQLLLARAHTHTQRHTHTRLKITCRTRVKRRCVSVYAASEHLLQRLTALRDSGSTALTLCQVALREIKEDWFGISSMPFNLRWLLCRTGKKCWHRKHKCAVCGQGNARRRYTFS